jgi:hypothetical protein
MAGGAGRYAARVAVPVAVGVTFPVARAVELERAEKKIDRLDRVPCPQTEGSLALFGSRAEAMLALLPRASLSAPAERPPLVSTTPSPPMPLLDPALPLRNDLPPIPPRPTARNEAPSSSGRETRRADEPNAQRAPDEAEAGADGARVPVGFDRSHRAEHSAASGLDDDFERVAARRAGRGAR